MRAPIHSQKHYVQQSRSQVATVAVSNIDIALSVAIQNVDLGDEVIEGSIIKAVFVEMWLLDSSNDGSFVVTLAKYPGAVPGLTFAQTNALNNWENKKNLLYMTQGLSANNGVGNPVPILRQWFKIPKSKQRFGLGDKLILSITNNGLNNLEFCGFFTYKSYT